MSYSVISDPAAIKAKMDSVDARRDELRAWQKCVRGNAARLMALTDISVVCGNTRDPESCVPVSQRTLGLIGATLLHRITRGVSLNGKTGNWSCGYMGSRWMDLNAKDYGVDYVRAGFFSRKFGGTRPGGKPYAIQVMVEKARGSFPDCCLCGKVCENEFGNNPRPVPHNKGEDGVCCNKCNSKKVIPARMAGRF